MLQIITTEFGNAHDWLFTGGKITVENRWRVKCLKFFVFPFSVPFFSKRTTNGSSPTEESSLKST